MAFFQLFIFSFDKQMLVTANKKYNDIIKMVLCSVCSVSTLCYMLKFFTFLEFSPQFDL